MDKKEITSVIQKNQELLDNVIFSISVGSLSLIFTLLDDKKIEELKKYSILFNFLIISLFITIILHTFGLIIQIKGNDNMCYDNDEKKNEGNRQSILALKLDRLRNLLFLINITIIAIYILLLFNKILISTIFQFSIILCLFVIFGYFILIKYKGNL